MKKMINYMFIFFLVIISMTDVKALSVSKNTITIKRGEKDTVELYANVSEEVTNIEFTLVYTTYDVPANFIVNSNFTNNSNGSVHSVSFGTPQTGSILLGTININTKAGGSVLAGTINVYNAKATTSLGETINLNKQEINVKIETPAVETPPVTEPTAPKEPEPSKKEENKKEETKKEEPKKEVTKEEEKIESSEKEETTNQTYNLLEKIDSDIVKIDIQEDVFEYTVTINKETLELDLKPVAIDTNSKIDITSQKIEELKDNKILITVKNGEEEQIYTINVNMIKDFEKAEIDNGKFEENNSYKGKWIVLIIVLIPILMVGLLLSKKR